MAVRCAHRTDENETLPHAVSFTGMQQARQQCWCRRGALRFRAKSSGVSPARARFTGRRVDRKGALRARTSLTLRTWKVGPARWGCTFRLRRVLLVAVLDHRRGVEDRKVMSPDHSWGTYCDRAPGPMAASSGRTRSSTCRSTRLRSNAPFCLPSDLTDALVTKSHESSGLSPAERIPVLLQDAAYRS